MTQKTPKPVPTTEEISQMRSIWSNWWLHYYQLLFFHPNKYTGPDKVGSKYYVCRVNDAQFLGLEIRRTGYPDFTFGIPSGGQQSQEELDAEILYKIELIETAIKESRTKIHSRACCPLAVTKPCVCYKAFSCILHGEQHIGTHD